MDFHQLTLLPETTFSCLAFLPILATWVWGGLWFWLPPVSLSTTKTDPAWLLDHDSFTGGTALTWIYFPTVLQWVRSRCGVSVQYTVHCWHWFGFDIVDFDIRFRNSLADQGPWLLQSTDSYSFPFLSHHTIAQPLGTLPGTICAYYWISTSVPLLSNRSIPNRSIPLHFTYIFLQINIARRLWSHKKWIFEWLTHTLYYYFR